MTQHAKQQHGGWARAAQRRGESYKLCITPGCGQRAHPRRFQAAPVEVEQDEPVERPTPIRIAGMVVFILVGMAAIAYGLPILDAAVRGG